jgi:hypothetical protein
MKKYLLGIFAIVIAIGFSSFTTAKQKKGVALHWYDVTYTVAYPNGAIMGGQGTPSYIGFVEKSSLDNCDTPPEVDCQRGFSSPLPAGTYTIPNEDSPTDFTLRENPQD